MHHPTAVFLQEACLQHQFIRSKDVSTIVERPERLRAVNVGIAAAVARIEANLARDHSQGGGIKSESEIAEEDLTAALQRLNIANHAQYPSASFPIRITKSDETLNVLSHPAVKFVHGDIEGDVYLENLISWARQSRNKISSEGSEIPDGLSQGDLYLCPTSMVAISGALATVCEAVDSVVGNSHSHSAPDDQLPTARSGFVAVRPPGHHCGEDTPSGFCFVNNVVVGAAHAHLKHNINRAIIFDIDLHHGNGTQSLVWQINEESYRQRLEQSYGAPATKPGLQVFYGSLHDILSYPCEDGKPELVQAASTSIHGPHGQYVENIHLLPYITEENFWEELYAKYYAKLFERAATFVKETASDKGKDDVIIFISCGFDACEHEYESMSRHGRKVPVGFYHRFAQDAQALADKVAQGRLISVLEGGYSDRALTSGVIAHLSGLAAMPYSPDWWSLENLASLEKATKKRKGGRSSLPNTPPESWLERTLEVFATIDSNPPPTQPVAPAMSMSLRDRSKPSSGRAPSSMTATEPLQPPKASSAPKKNAKSKNNTSRNVTQAVESTDAEAEEPKPQTQKRLPRVILKLGPDPKLAGPHNDA
ncbi:Arginase/deacetylase [Trametopsis cervina]|nr:Arginase/deacetylase [Trametopsis cervina]